MFILELTPSLLPVTETLNNFNNPENLRILQLLGWATAVWLVLRGSSLIYTYLEYRTWLKKSNNTKDPAVSDEYYHIAVAFNEEYHRVKGHPLRFCHVWENPAVGSSLLDASRSKKRSHSPSNNSSHYTPAGAWGIPDNTYAADLFNAAVKHGALTPNSLDIWMNNSSLKARTKVMKEFEKLHRLSQRHPNNPNVKAHVKDRLDRICEIIDKNSPDIP